MKKITKRGLSLLLVAVLSLSVNLAFALSREREIVVNHMSEMANVEWIAGENIYDLDLNCILYLVGVNYHGIPWSPRFRIIDLDVLKRLLKDECYEGMIDSFGNIVTAGSDCSSAVSMAWQQINPDIPYLSTYNMIPTSDNLYNIIKVGDYFVPTEATTTTEIIRLNDEKTIRLAYEFLKPGDAVVTRNDRSGHVILVKEVDLMNRRIIGIEQAGVDENGVLKGKNGQSSWNDNRILTFDDLYKNAYIPITIRDLAESDR